MAAMNAGREATTHPTGGYPVVELDEENVEEDEGFVIIRMSFKRNYGLGTLCIACCTMTPMTFMMKDKIKVVNGEIVSIERQLGVDI